MNSINPVLMDRIHNLKMRHNAAIRIKLTQGLFVLTNRVHHSQEKLSKLDNS